LRALPPGSPSLRLLAAHAANLLAGFAAVLDGLALLVADPARIRSRRRTTPHVPDWLPALVNGGRAFVTIGAVEVFWIATEWPNGWEGRIYKRLVAMPDEAEPLQRAQLLTALSLGSEIIELRRAAARRF
jgi:hypothetical protein